MSQARAIITIPEAMKAVKEYYGNHGHSEKYAMGIVQAMGAFQRYCAEKEVAILDKEVIFSFMEERYGMEQRLADKKGKTLRVLYLLTDLLEFGVVQRRHCNARRIPPQFSVPVDRVLDELRRGFKTEETINRYHQTLQLLTLFFDAQGVQSPGDLTLRHFTENIKTSMGRHGKQHVAHQLRVMRVFLRSMHAAGDIPEDFSEKLPKIHNATHQSHLPSAFTAEQVERLLAVVDRSSPVGKRDYALLLLAAKLGLRSGDIRQLRFEHVDWENNAIRLTQQKTGQPLSLPLLPDIGWALIDYIKHGRPVSNSPEIFVRQVAPHVPMKYYDTMLVKYLQKAGIAYEQMQHHGMHALRHSLATTLLEQQTSIEVIQEVLGHTDPATTRHYVTVDVQQLRACAMEVPHAAKI